MEWKSKKGKIEELNRDFDYAFWQSVSPIERLEAAWAMVVDYHVNILGENENKLRLQRSLVALKQQES